MNKYTCANCGTENEEEYQFCKNCGKKISFQNEYKNFIQPEKKYLHTENFGKANTDFFDTGIAGVLIEEMALFIGTKTHKILPRFIEMERHNSKASWCWVVAILGFLFGPIGVAFWFFYRRMYKYGFILSAIGFTVSLIDAFIYSVCGSGDVSQIYNLLLEYTVANEKELLLASLNKLNSFDSIVILVTDFLHNLFNVFITVFFGFFGMWLYKKHAVKKIKDFKSVQSDIRYYKLGISAMGGVSSGMVLVGIIIYLASIYSSILF